MKKNVLFIFLIVIYTGVMKAQVGLYNFESSVETYTAITGGTVLRDGTSTMDSWASAQQTIPSFTFNGVAYTTAYVTSNGILTLGGIAPSSTSTTGISSTVGSGIAICPFSADLDRATTTTSTEIRWEVIGDEIIFQWQQMKRYGQTESFDFQVKMNSVNGIIKFVYKLNSGPGSGTSYQPQVGIRTSTSDYKNRLVSTGTENWDTSLPGTLNSNTCRFTSASPAKSFNTGLTYTWTPPSPCTGTPTPGNTLTSINPVCPNVNFILSLQNSVPGTGISYQWQSSPDGNDPWNDIGTSTATYTVSQTLSTWYRCVVTCSNSGLSGTSNPVQVLMNVAPVPYFEGFLTTTIPVCWNTSGWSIGSVRGVTGNPGYNIYKNLYNIANTGTFISGDIGPVSSGMVLTFDYKLANYNVPYDPPAIGSGFFIISISKDGGVSYDVLETVDNNGVAGWQSKSYNLSLYAGYNIKFKIVGNWISGDWDLAFDNFKIEQPPACLPPTNLSVSNISNNGAQINWNIPGGYQIDSFFDIYVDLQGNPAPGAESIPTAGGISGTSYTWTGGQPNTNYSAYVRTDCGFTNPKIDNFWMSMPTPGVLDPVLSGGTVNDPGETGIWYFYNQAPIQPWWNIWFYNDPLDTAKIKKIRLGFWVKPFAPGLQGNLSYVINWSTDTWNPGPGVFDFPKPLDEVYIARSPQNGPMVINGLQWVELYYAIYDYNPAWISVDIWGDNIIIEEAPMPPPPTSPLFSWWNPTMQGGLIVHECLPKSSLSSWVGPVNFQTLCSVITAPFTENFEVIPPPCWTVSSNPVNKNWAISTSASGYGVGSNSAICNFYNFASGIQSNLFSPDFDASSLTHPIVKFDYAYATYQTEIDQMQIYASSDYGQTFNPVPFVTLLGGVSGPLNTAGAVSSSFVPSAQQWRTAEFLLPTGTNKFEIVGLSAFGNNLYIDNVSVQEAPPCIPFEEVINAEICEGETYLWRGGVFDETGTYFDNYTTIYPPGCDSVYVLNLTVKPLPDPAGPITGPVTVPEGTNGVIYSVPPIGNASGYEWDFSGDGVLISGTGHSVTLDFSFGATSGQLSVRGENDCGFGAESFFDIFVQIIPPCDPPTNLQVVSVTSNSALLDWTGGNMWNVEVGLPGFTPGTGTVVTGAYGTTQKPWTAANLSANTSYEFYVQNDCGFVNPRVDNFWMAMPGFGMLDPYYSGGTEDDLYETGMWYLYNQAPGQPWWNIWFYNDPLDTNRLKKIRMGFWVHPFGPGPSTISYVFNWSDETWQGPGFPTPAQEVHIERSPVNGPMMVNGMQWIEIYYVIEDYNPMWISVDIWGENIIIEQMPLPPPPTSPLMQWWNPGMMGGLIVHECLPKTSISDWTGPQPIKTCQDYQFAFNDEICPNEFPYEWETYTGANAITAPGQYLVTYPTTNPPGCDSTLILNLVAKPLPGNAGAISGTANVTEGTSGVAYTVPVIDNATGYVWSYSGTGVTINGSGNAVTLDFAMGATSGQLSVKGENECGYGVESFFDIFIDIVFVCDPPTNLDVLSVSSNSAVLAWTGGNMWNVEVGLPGFTPGTGTEVTGDYGTTQNPWTAANLSANTSYEFYVQHDCGFSNPKADNFWVSFDAAGVLDPLHSGGTVNDPFETGMWYLYNQAPSQPWWNIWFYNDPPDTNKIKKIRMGFWVKPKLLGFPSNLSYVVNWSTMAWQGPGFPTPADEAYIERSPVNGPFELNSMLPGMPQWMEFYYVIEEYNPAWISVDIWGENIEILPVPQGPPYFSLLAPWYTQNMIGGIIIHECMPKNKLSSWAGPKPFKTCQDYLVVLNDDICSDELPYTWEGLQITAGGTYQVSYPTTNPPGCDSTIVLNLTVHPTYEFITDAEICDGESYSWRGNNYNASGTYSEAYLTQYGCDSIYTLKLIVYPTYLFVEDVSVYDNQLPYLWQGGSYSSPGTYFANYQTDNDCDSIYQLNLTVKPSVSLWVTKNIGRAVQAEWLPKAGASLYQLRYRQIDPVVPPPLNGWVYVTQSSQLMRKIVPLIPGVTYELELRYKSGLSWLQAYAPITFTTNVVSFTPTYDIGTKLKLDWDDLGDEYYDVSSYVLQYRLSSATTWITKGYYTSNSAVMGLMQEGGEYTYRVLPRYNELSFDWTDTTMLTTHYIPVNISNYNGASADFSWMHPADPDPYSYYLQYRTIGNSWVEGSRFVVYPSNNATVNFNFPSMLYEYRLIVWYEIDGVYQGWGATGWRPVANTGAKDEVMVEFMQNQMNVYPNPVSNELTVEVYSTETSVNNWNLYDVNGKLVMSGGGSFTAGPNYFYIDMSQLPTGLYMLQSSFNGTVESARFMKQ